MREDSQEIIHLHKRNVLGAERKLYNRRRLGCTTHARLLVQVLYSAFRLLLLKWLHLAGVHLRVFRAHAKR